MNNVLIYPRGQLTELDRARLEGAGIVAVEADDPQKVVMTIPQAASVDVEAIAEQLVQDWQARDLMPQMAWDFRGFAVDAMRRALIDSAGGAKGITGSVSPQMRDANACTPQPADGAQGCGVQMIAFKPSTDDGMLISEHGYRLGYGGTPSCWQVKEEDFPSALAAPAEDDGAVGELLIEELRKVAMTIKTGQVIGRAIAALQARPAATAQVHITDELIERACKRYAFREDGAVFPDAYSEHEVLAERTLMREFLTHVLAAAPAAPKGGVAVGHTHDVYAHSYWQRDAEGNVTYVQQSIHSIPQWVKDTAEAWGTRP